MDQGQQAPPAPPAPPAIAAAPPVLPAPPLPPPVVPAAPEPPAFALGARTLSCHLGLQRPQHRGHCHQTVQQGHLTPRRKV